MSVRGKNALKWCLIIIVMLQFVIAALWQNNGLMDINYPEGFYSYIFLLIGMSLFGLLLKKSRMTAGLLQVLILGLSAYYHFLAEQIFPLLINISFIGLCCIIIWLEQEKRLYADQ